MGVSPQCDLPAHISSHTYDNFISEPELQSSSKYLQKPILKQEKVYKMRTAQIDI